MKSTPPSGSRRPSEPDRERFRQFIDTSTLGDLGARALRARVSDSEVDKILAQVAARAGTPPIPGPNFKSRTVIGARGETGVRSNVANQARFMRDRRVIALLVTLLVPVAVFIGMRFDGNPPAASTPTDVARLQAGDRGPGAYLLTAPAGSEPAPIPIGSPPLSPPGAASSYPGNTPGLFGGIRDDEMGGREEIIAFYRSDYAAAAAAAAVLDSDSSVTWSGHGVTAETLDDYVRELTPVWLRADIRVTNHYRWADRGAARQAVLQAGTVVLVDATGVPRIRSISGSPLTTPTAPEGPVTYYGPMWRGFSADTVVAVVASEQPQKVLVLFDLRATALFARPIGTMGGQDQNAPESISPPGSGSPSSSPSSTSLPTNVPSSTLDTSGNWILESEFGGVTGTLTGSEARLFLTVPATSGNIGWNCTLVATDPIGSASMECRSSSSIGERVWSSTGSLVFISYNGRVKLRYDGVSSEPTYVRQMTLRPE